MEILNGKDMVPKFKTVMLYSRPGIGKTSALGALPGRTLVVDIDRGTSVLAGNENVSIVQMDAELKVMSEVIEMLDRKCEFENVCIDTLTEFERSMLAIKGKTGKNGGAPEMLHYNQVNYAVVSLVRRLRVLPVNVVLTAWLEYKDVIAIDGSKYSQAQPMFSGKTADQVCGLCDIVGELMMNPKDDSRFVVFEPGPTRIARDRIWKRKFCKPEDLLRGDMKEDA